MTETIPPSSVGKRPPRVWRIVLGAVLLLIGMINSANVKTAPGDLAGALGALTGVLTLVALAVWLIASGLPKSIGSEDLKLHDVGQAGAGDVGASDVRVCRVRFQRDKATVGRQRYSRS
jgi:hypothetical protein